MQHAKITILSLFMTLTACPAFAGKPGFHANPWMVIALYATLAACLALTGVMAWRLYADAARAARNDARPEEIERSRIHIQQMLASLGAAERQHFESLRKRCRDLSRVSGEPSENPEPGLSDLSETHARGINRLLWIYLRLSAARSEMDRFFLITDPAVIQSQIDHARQRLDALGETDPSEPGRFRLRKSLVDLLGTAERRMANVRMVRDNHAFISLELERLSAKIESILEMGIHRRKTEEITGEIDAVSSSVAYAEQTIRELETVIGVSLDGDETPGLLGYA